MHEVNASKTHQFYYILASSNTTLLQKQAFLCSAKCCEDQQYSQEVMQKCIQSCMRPMMEAEQSLKSEVEQFQVYTHVR